MLLDDTQVQFTGRWAFHINPIIPNQFHSFHATNHSGDYVALNFTGIGVQVFGLVGPSNGNYTVQLDGKNQSFTGEASTTSQALLFTQQDLDSSHNHELIVSNDIEGRLLTVDLFNITLSQPTGSSPKASSGISRGAIIAIALVAALCALILVGSLAYLLQRRRRRAKRERRRRTEESFGPRMRSIALPSERSTNMETRYPWMRDGNVTLGELSRTDLPPSEPYDPYTERRFNGPPPTMLKPANLVPTAEDSDDVMDIIPRTEEELEALRPRVTTIPPPPAREPDSRSYAGG